MIARNHQATPHVISLIKAGATQTETSLFKQYDAGESVDLVDDYDFPARTFTDTKKLRVEIAQCVH